MPTGRPIDLGYARQLAKNFRDNKLEKQTLLPNDAQAVWFSKEVLLDALGGADVTGIRFYFGAYEEHPGYPENPYDYNKLTLVLVQTGPDKISIDRGGVMEDAYLDIITNPSTPPSYPPTSGPVVITKNYFNDGQMNPPPVNAIGLGLMDF